MFDTDWWGFVYANIARYSHFLMGLLFYFIIDRLDLSRDDFGRFDPQNVRKTFIFPLTYYFPLKSIGRKLSDHVILITGATDTAGATG